MTTISPSSGSPRRKPSGCPGSVSPRRKPSGCPGSVSPRRKPSGCPLPVSGCPISSRPLSAPRAFTLVELLVVIGIIGLLAALLTPVVMRSLASARNAAIKAEIDMLHMALMNYQSEYGVLPPCNDTQFTAATGYTTGGEAAKHLRRIFPRCANPASELNKITDPNVTGTPRVGLVPTNALTAWLGGYTTNPQSPLDGPRQRLFDFDKSRIDPATGEYFPSGKRGSPFVYIPATQYATRLYTGASSYGAHFTPPPLSPVPLPANTLLWFTNLALAAPQRQEYANPDTFQILCAGRDEVFGTDDDLSNFWPGTRREYLDSLKD
jgi:prepilin-type N-terminal cleavage/methylation domain-containing protein